MALPSDRTSKPLDQKLQEVNRAFEEKEAIKKATELGISYVDLVKLPINIDLLSIVTEEECRTAQAMPFFRTGRKLRLAVVDPQYPATLALIEQLKQKEYAINLNISTAAGLEDALKIYHVEFYKQKTAIENVYEEADLGNMLDEIKNIATLKDKLELVSGEESANALLVGAMRAGSSDIHIEPYDKITKVRFRIDGVLQDVFTVSREKAINMIAQFKHSAHIKLNITNRPQDGRFSFYVNRQKVDVRLSSLPTMFGETLVMRLLSTQEKLLTLTDLGLAGAALKLVEAAIARPNGLVLATGPTGSGKTTSLYALLHMLNTADQKIITLEDPVEYNVVGIVQSQVNAENNYDFASGLRSVLRQDPDILMVGEIRDRETAEIACQASLTGHIVLSTLHTNNAIATIPRLINMGVAPFILAPALDTVIAQRLVRRICPHCQEVHQYSDQELVVLNELIASVEQVQGVQIDKPEHFMIGKGCERCSYTGYRGQIGIYEVFTVDRTLEKMILAIRPDGEMLDYVRSTQKMLTLREAGVLKIFEGVTTLAEVMRVTSDLEV
ncbi:type II/IV secretion system protein [Candidatus Gracilibacteria bacterium]|nr:type II/IV secretion system protein [Candidatus Gracilibacteria bacterium]